MAWTRRDILRLGAGVVVLPRLTACGEAGEPAYVPPYEYDGPPADGVLFRHGVASGDPTTDAVVLWSRVELAAGEQALEGYVELARTPDFMEPVAAAYLTFERSRFGCAKIDVDGLEPGQEWYYRFRARDQISDVGRTRTAPTSPEGLRVALVSCSNFVAGHFHVYRFLAERDDVDLVVHAGDYIYEYAGGSGDRVHDPAQEIVALKDYRRRYAQYREDPDLRALHARHPMTITWDDHEIANNSYATGASAHDPDREGSWADRVAAARQAWLEWMPVREAVPGKLYRVVPWGDLAQIVVLDSRIEGRDQPSNLPEVVQSAERQLLGVEQEDWLFTQLADGGATWNLVLQQVVMGQWSADGTPALNPDQWDGYPAARTRFLEAARDGSGTTVVLTGDVHASFAHDLPIGVDGYEVAQERSVAVEAVTPGVTSSGADLGGLIDALADLRRNVRYAETTLRGCVLLDVDADRTVAQWWNLSDGSIERPEYTAPDRTRTLVVEAGAPWWVDREEDFPDRR